MYLSDLSKYMATLMKHEFVLEGEDKYVYVCTHTHAYTFEATSEEQSIRMQCIF